MRSRIVVVLAVGAATVAAGCGSSGKRSSSTASSSSAASSTTAPPSSANAPSSAGGDLATFKAGFAADKAEFKKLGADLGASIKTARQMSDSALASEFTALADRAAQVNAKLRALNPPAKFKGELAALTSAFDQVTGDLRAVSAAAGAHDAAKTRASAIKMLQDSARVKAADLLISKQLGLA